MFSPVETFMLLIGGLIVSLILMAWIATKIAMFVLELTGSPLLSALLSVVPTMVGAISLLAMAADYGLIK
jgi:uncharacterized membrane protein AbrB (regulator of aidB expression)